MFEVQILAARVEDCSSWWANLRPQTVVFGKVLRKKSCLYIYIHTYIYTYRWLSKLWSLSGSLLQYST